VLGEDVDHPGREAAVRDDRDPLARGLLLQLLLLEDDLGVPAEVAEVRAGLGGLGGEIVVEVVGDRAHRRVGLAHQRADGIAIAHVEPGGDEARARVRRQEGRQMLDVQVGQPDLGHVGVLEQVVRARGALQPRAEN
jgi:hypothetical protein